MPRYFFDCTDDRFSRDTDGTDLPDTDTARIEAVRFMAEMMRDRPACVWDGGNVHVTVTDEAGLLLCAIVVNGVKALEVLRG